MLIWRRWSVGLGAVAVLFLVGCAGPMGSPTTPPTPPNTAPVAETPAAPTSTPTPTETPTASATTSPVQTSTPTAAPTATPTPEPTEVPTITTLTVLEGSEARYRVREQFADRDFPNDAVGETSDFSGSIVFNGAGVVQPEQSKLVVDLRTLRSDDDDRDEFLLTESLESERYPLAEFVVQETPGLLWPLPQEGEATFQLIGDMTLHNNTSPLTWEATAQFSPEQVTGMAKTNFPFSTFHMVRPSRFFLLSVEDDIRLELDFIVSISEMAGG